MARWTVPPEATRTWLATGAGRLRAGWLRIVESTIAAAAAWLVAVHVLHHETPFFAPAAALIVLGVTQGQRLQRAVEIVVGVAVGVLVADAITKALGPHTTLSLVVVTVLTLIAAVFLGGGPILAVQATVSAVYVAVVTPPGGGEWVPSRFADALVGGTVALLINQLPLHRDPMGVLFTEAGQVFDELSAVLAETADALAAHDPDAAMAALEKARATDPAVAKLGEALSIGQDALRLDPLRRRQRDLLRRYENVVREVDYAVRNVRVLVRAVVVVTRGPTKPPDTLAEALRYLASAVTALSADLRLPREERGDRAGKPPSPLVTQQVLAAVRTASSGLTDDSPLPVVTIVWQIRSTAVDLLRGTGMELASVLDLVEEALAAPE